MKNIKKLALFCLFLVMSAIVGQPIQASALKTGVGCVAAGLGPIMGAYALLNEFAVRHPNMNKKDLKELNAEQLKLVITTLGFGGLAAYLYNTGGNTAAIATAAIAPAATIALPILLLMRKLEADHRAGHRFSLYPR